MAFTALSIPAMTKMECKHMQGKMLCWLGDTSSVLAKERQAGGCRAVAEGRRLSTAFGQRQCASRGEDYLAYPGLSPL